MKKKLPNLIPLSKSGIKKLLLPMKLTLIIIFLSVLQVSATVYSQITVNLDVHDKSIREVLKTIEQQSQIRFFYSDDLLIMNEMIDIKADNKNIIGVLDDIFTKSPLTYKAYDNNLIVIAPRELLQQQKITGTVTDENGNSLPGVNVQVEGTTQGTISDISGEYTIDSPSPNASLIFTFIGYSIQKVPVSGRKVIDIKMVPDITSLEEVVVIGYGVQRKSDFTGSVGSVKGGTLQERPATSVSQVLDGRITGVNVFVNSGRPGGKPNIRIRGNTSISITNDPLYIVDGVISPSINYINPNDISSIEVLKDASSTAIYGARGSNGVILVTTKRGSGKGGEIKYESNFSIGILPREMDVLNAKEFLQVEDIAYQNAQKYDPVGWAVGKYIDPKLKRTSPLLFDANGNPLYDTDWQKEVTQKAFSLDHNLSFTGGDAKNNYGIYLGYRNEEGIIKSSYLKRYSARFVFDSQIKTWLKVGGTLSYNDQTEKQVDEENTSVGVFREMIEQIPIIPVKFPDGSWASNANYPNVESAPNPVQIINDMSYILKTKTVLGNVYTNIALAEGLELRSTLGISILNVGTNEYSGRNLNFIALNQGGIANVTSAYNNSWQFENYLTYNKKFSDIHSLTGLLGVSWQHVDYYNYSATSWGFSDDFFQTNNLGVAANPQPSTSGTSAYGLNSYFSRINYGFREKYLLTVTGRVDGSSKFGASERYAFFPSAALAWKASEEDFIKSIPVISKLKLRTSYGYTGNSEILAYQGLAGLGNYSVIFNDTRATGIGVGRLPNSGLKWEKTSQADFGIELGLFKSKISLEVDLYNKLTSNMLLAAPVPATSGFSTVTENIGSMQNRGIEFDLNTVNISSNDFSWNTTFTISVNKNKVVALGTTNADVFPGPTWVSETNIARIGEPISSFYGYVRLGTWGTAEAAEAATYNKKPGDLKYKDINQDGKINSLDRVIIGKGIPDGFGSFMNTFSYKNLYLTLDIQFMYGNDLLVCSKGVQEDRTGLANSRATVLNAWTPENQNTMIAQLRPTAAGYDLFQDTQMIENGSFIRGRNLLLGYNFSPELIKKIHLNNLRLTASIQNLFLITKYTGFDPEVALYTETFAQGIIKWSSDYPKPRVFMFGLYIGF